MSEINTDSAVIEDLLSRGVENVISSKDDLAKKLGSGDKLNIYFGIDPTATRIHLGHAFALRKLDTLAKMGHNVTFLIGDFTSLVGDTSDKNDERPMLTPEEIKINFETYQEQASKLLDFDNVQVKFNSEWLSKLGFDDVLQLAGNFSVNDFTSRELIRDRLDAGKRVSLPETLYPLMQGYDSFYLDTDIQLGGTDQTFNMQAGRTLLKRLKDKESFIIANGFLTGTDGRKMSKSWDNAIWLEDSPEDIFGKVMSIKDDLIDEYYTYGTNVELDEVAKRIKTSKDSPMDAKKELARTIVSELYGEDVVEHAEQHFVNTVQNKSANTDAPKVLIDDDAEEISIEQLCNMILEQKLADSRNEVKRLIDQGGLRVNDVQLKSTDSVKLNQGENTVRVGKRRYMIVERPEHG